MVRSGSYFDKSFLSDDGQDFADELITATNAIEHIVIYAIPRYFAFPTDTDFAKIPLTTEEEIRQCGNQFVFRDINTEQSSMILMMLYSAPQVTVSPAKNKVKTKKLLGLEGYREGGMVIDTIAYTGEIVTTFIMQNGLPVFYEKGKEGTYYKMPKVLLDKFSINIKEFVDTIHNKKLNTLPQTK
jgi:hypothetical protein